MEMILFYGTCVFIGWNLGRSYSKYKRNTIEQKALLQEAKIINDIYSEMKEFNSVRGGKVTISKDKLTYDIKAGSINDD